jgi:hypothetical protein
MFIKLSSGALVACLFGLPALAATDTLPPQLEACASLMRDAERLSCFDKAIAAIRRGEQPGKELSPENMFGASTGIARPEKDAEAVKREELRQISGTVTSLRNTDDGMIIIELDNGQVWRQQDANVRLMVSKGDQVTVVRASLGTFRIADKTGRFARFRRVR